MHRTWRILSSKLVRLLGSQRKFSSDQLRTSIEMDDSLTLSLMLPSRQETCRFFFNLRTATVANLMDEIRSEDSGVDDVQIYDHQGFLVSKTYSIRSLLKYSFTIQLNRQKTFLFDPIGQLSNKTNSVSEEKINENLSLENTVTALYQSLNSMKIYHKKYLELQNEVNALKNELQPLEKRKTQLAEICQRYTSRCIWYGLATMSFQVGLLAELTWDVYSWDIVEPISYFIAYGTAIGAYAFHLMTRADFEYITISDRLFLRKFYHEAKRQSFDIEFYNRLKDRLFSVSTDLARLRAPLSLSLSVPPNSLKCKITGEEVSTLNAYRTHQRFQQ